MGALANAREVSGYTGLGSLVAPSRALDVRLEASGPVQRLRGFRPFQGYVEVSSLVERDTGPGREEVRKKSVRQPDRWVRTDRLGLFQPVGPPTSGTANLKSLTRNE